MAEDEERRILIAQGFPSERSSMVRLLALEGFEVKDAEDYEKTVGLLQKGAASGQPFDVLVIDPCLSQFDRDGYKLIKEIQERKIGLDPSKQPKIVVTSYVDSEGGQLERWVTANIQAKLWSNIFVCDINAASEKPGGLLYVVRDMLGLSQRPAPRAEGQGVQISDTAGVLNLTQT